ncbi:hypothetical protein [Mycobacterium sp. 48b]|uniref:hypothetical protein n=1 Tax=Mycobacterium sp. 48b TaxID=3400426 RepID=UPI003AAB9704
MSTAAPATTAAALPAIPPEVMQIIGPIILFGTIAFGLLVVLPVGWAVGTAYEVIARILGLPPTLPFAGPVATTAGAQAMAAPSDPITFLTENAQILADGFGQSANRAGVAVVGEAVLPFVTAVLAVASPARIPTILLLAQESSESIWTGTLNTKFGLDYDEFVPGFYIPADVKPTGEPGDAHDVALRRIVDGAVLPATVVAVNHVAANLTEAGVPAVVEQLLLSSEKVGATAFQVGAYVRASAVSAVQEPILAATEGGDVGAALQAGATQFHKAVFGDPDAADAHVDPYDPTSPTAPSLAKLGAIGSVTTVARQETEKIVGALVPSSNAPLATGKQASIGNGRNPVRSSGTDNPTAKSTANPPRKKPMRDAITKVRKDISHAAAQVRDNLKKVGEQ